MCSCPIMTSAWKDDKTLGRFRQILASRVRLPRTAPRENLVRSHPRIRCPHPRRELRPAQICRTGGSRARSATLLATPVEGAVPVPDGEPGGEDQRRDYSAGRRNRSSGWIQPTDAGNTALNRDRWTTTDGSEAARRRDHGSCSKGSARRGGHHRLAFDDLWIPGLEGQYRLLKENRT